MYFAVHNERTTTQIQCGLDEDVGRDVSGNMCALCANAGGILLRGSWGARWRREGAVRLAVTEKMRI